MPATLRHTVDAITFVTGNPGKVEEMRELLDPLGIAVVQDDRGYPEIQHDELSGVAEAGAGYLLATGVEPPFILEDAGLFIGSLKGFPGVYSSYVQHTIGNAGVLRLMRDLEAEQRGAAFLADLCFVDASGVPRHFEGRVQGRISQRARGSGGFGFDPIFIPDGHEKTLAEMTRAEKAAISHRGAAARAFAAHLGKEVKR